MAVLNFYINSSVVVKPFFTFDSLPCLKSSGIVKRRVEMLKGNCGYKLLGGQGQFWAPLTTDGPSGGSCKKQNWKRATVGFQLGSGAAANYTGAEDGFVQ